MATFNFSFDPGTSLQQMTGFQIAGQIWSSYLKDNTTLNIHVGVSSSLPKNVIGGALPGIRAAQKYQDVVHNLESDITSQDDQVSVANLRTKADYEAQFDTFDLKNGNNKGSRVKTKSINLTAANAKAINLGSQNTNELDGVILLSRLDNTRLDWNYDFTRSGPANPKSLDFLSTALHEIAHILGFVSGVDKPGWLNSQATDKSGADQYKKSLDDRISHTTALDLFRYSTAAGTNINDLSYGSFGSNKYFSIDGGQTAIAAFSTGADRRLGGDGEQASHWKNQNSPLGIMSPTLNPSSRINIGSIDLRALDAIGWNVDSNRLNNAIDWSSLLNQAKQTLATRLGQTVSWLDSNSTVATQQLSQSREQDISRMISQSEIYNWDPGEDDPFWQKIQNLYFQQGLFQTVETASEERALGGVSSTPKFDFTWDKPQNSRVQNVIAVMPEFPIQASVASDSNWTGFGLNNLQAKRSYPQLIGGGVSSNNRLTQAKRSDHLAQTESLKISDFDLEVI